MLYVALVFFRTTVVCASLVSCEGYSSTDCPAMFSSVSFLTYVSLRRFEKNGSACPLHVCDRVWFAANNCKSRVQALGFFGHFVYWNRVARLYVVAVDESARIG